MTPLGRRTFLKAAGVIPGVAAALTPEERILAQKKSTTSDTPPPKGAEMPTGKIGKLTISRLICGGNLISGFAHSRDLVYVSSLMKQYFTDEKILETLQVCEANGINTIVTAVEERVFGVLNRHRKNGGKLQWIAQLRAKKDDPLVEAKRAIDNGAVGAHLQGMHADSWLAGGEKGVDDIRKLVGFLKDKGLVAGCSSHKLSTPMALAKGKVELDYFFKTFHSHKYWSAGAEKERDNIWCKQPDETAAFMKDVKTPWIAFKVLAAGALSPTSGFKYALQGGADFMCVGMFDFQIADDVKILKGLFARGIKRSRPWRA